MNSSRSALLERHRCGTQLAAVMNAARTLPVEKRDVYVQRIAAMLTMRGRGHFTDSDAIDVAKLALTGLARQPAA